MSGLRLVNQYWNLFIQHQTIVESHSCYQYFKVTTVRVYKECFFSIFIHAEPCLQRTELNLS